MEFYLCRAMEVARLLESDLERLHAHEEKERIFREWDTQTQTFGKPENRIRRALFPSEIQECFKIPTLKDIWGIPETDQAQQAHAHRIRTELRALELSPKHDFLVMSVDEVHAFDKRVAKAVSEGKINFSYQGGPGRGRLRDSL